MSNTTLSPRIVPQGGGAAHIVFGDPIIIKLSGEETGGAFTLSATVTRPGSGVPPHIHHREDETFFVVEGEVEFRIGEKAVRARPGDTAFAPRGIPHTFTAVSPGPAKMMVIASPAGFDRMIAELGRLPDGPPDMAKVSEICGRYGVDFLSQAS